MRRLLHRIWSLISLPAPSEREFPSHSPMSLRTLARRGLAVCLPRSTYLTRGPRGSGDVCLTFDDGPHPEATPRLLDLLREQQVPATFFLIGREAEKYPDIVRRMAAEGHAVGNHSFSHPRRNSITAREMADEITRGAESVGHVLGAQPKLYRPPGGHVTGGDLWRLWRLGLTTVLWNVDPKDSSVQRTATDVQEWFHNRPLAGGDLVLLHDNQVKVVEVVAELVAATRSRNLRFATVEAWTK